MLGMFRTIMSIFCNESTHLLNKPECQQKCLNWSISFIPGPFIGYQHLGDLLIRVLSWSLFNERGAGELSADNARICSRANKSNSRKRGRIQGGVEAEANLEGPLYPERPCVSGLFFMTSTWVGYPIMAPSTGLIIPQFLPCLILMLVVPSLSRVQLFATHGLPCTPGFHVLLCLPEFAQIHIHWVSDAIQPSHPLPSPSPPAYNLSQHQCLSNESSLPIRWPKYWRFSFSISPSNEYSGFFLLGLTILISD